MRNFARISLHSAQHASNPLASLIYLSPRPRSGGFFAPRVRQSKFSPAPLTEWLTIAQKRGKVPPPASGSIYPTRKLPQSLKTQAKPIYSQVGNMAQSPELVKCMNTRYFRAIIARYCLILAPVLYALDARITRTPNTPTPHPHAHAPAHARITRTHPHAHAPAQEGSRRHGVTRPTTSSLYGHRESPDTCTP